MRISLPVACWLLPALLLISTPLEATPKKGKKAPGFSLRDPKGAWFKLADLTYAGPAKARKPKHVVLLDFFSTDCKPCVKALPKLVKLHNKYKSKGVKVVMLALPEKADTDERKLAAFLKRRALPFLVLVDSYGKAAGKYVMRKGVARLPAMFVIDKKSVIRDVVRKMDHKTLLRLDRLVEKLAR